MYCFSPRRVSATKRSWQQKSGKFDHIYDIFINLPQGRVRIVGVWRLNPPVSCPDPPSSPFAMYPGGGGGGVGVNPKLTYEACAEQLCKA